jgi:hypothetical protein
MPATATATAREATVSAAADRQEIVAPATTTLTLAPEPPDPFAGLSTRALHRELRRRRLESKSRDVRANPANAAGRYKETREVIGMARRGLRALRKRIGGELELEQLPALRDLAAEADETFKRAAALLHKSKANPNGYSWQEIADALGTDKPAAWRMFHKRRQPRHPKGAS